MTNAHELAVHPAADVFPMLNDDELNELADDIKANGLVHPIVVKDGTLIDGRNRLEACKRAGVEPRFVELNGSDPATFILSANINRRHMTTSQRAMAYAMIAALPSTGGRGKTVRLPDGLTKQRISEARIILKWAPEFSAGVLSGSPSLDKAYATASDRKVAAEAPVKRLAALRERDPDLADKVVEEALSIEDAEGAARGRRDRERAARQGTYDALAALERYLFKFREPSHRAELVRIIEEHPEEISKDDVLQNLGAWIEGMQATVQAINAGDA